MKRLLLFLTLCLTLLASWNLFQTWQSIRLADGALSRRIPALEERLSNVGINPASILPADSAVTNHQPQISSDETKQLSNNNNDSPKGITDAVTSAASLSHQPQSTPDKGLQSITSQGSPWVNMSGSPTVVNNNGQISRPVGSSMALPLPMGTPIAPETAMPIESGTPSSVSAPISSGSSISSSSMPSNGTELLPSTSTQNLATAGDPTRKNSSFPEEWAVYKALYGSQAFVEQQLKQPATP